MPSGHQKYFGKTQQSKLMKTRRDSAEVHAECSVCVFVIDGKDHDQQHNDDRMVRLEAKLHFGYQKLNSISEFRIPRVGSVETLHHRNAKTLKYETPKYQTIDLTPFWSFRY